MLTVGDRFPEFDLAAVQGLDDPKITRVSSKDFAGRWLVAFSWPMDFTFVCPTEIAAFGAAHKEFAALDAAVFGFSVDSEYVHLAWRQRHPHLRHLAIPMLADVKRELSGALGILDKDAGVALRATFVVDPEGVVRHVSAYGLDTGRSVAEVLRTVAALRTGGLTPCEWHTGEALLAG
jgi:peroxiredoxin (alkyl hydroperoxide reductase subunit C)